jgi:hypothetical protein
MKLFRCGIPDDMCVFSQLNLSIAQASLLVTCPNLVDTQDPMSKDITKRVKRTLLIRMGFISFKKCEDGYQRERKLIFSENDSGAMSSSRFTV